MGDSLTDNGNLYNRLFKLIPKSPPYFQGEFSDGHVWADEVGKYFHDRYNIAFENFAVGGTTVILRSPTHALPYFFGEEINEYLLHDLWNKEKNKVLYAIWIGANDYLDELQQDPDSLTTEVVNRMVQNIVTLIDKGAEHFLIFSLPDLALTPRATIDNIKPRLGYVSESHNIKLLAAVNTLKLQHPNVDFLYIDVFSLLRNVVNFPEVFNQKYHLHLTNVTEACWMGKYTIHPNTTISRQLTHSAMLNEAYSVGLMADQGIQPCEHPEEFIFWDKLHPTAVIHHLLANLVIEKINTFIPIPIRA